MKNLEIADLFYNIAEILEIKEENPFRVRSYRKVGQVLETLTEDVFKIYERGCLAALQEIPGVGEAIARKIEEILKTGRLEYYEKLKTSVPPGLVALLSIPEIGPKTARLLYDRLKITSIEELEKAIKEHKVRELPGMGAKTEDNILRGIDLLRRRKERLPLGVAQPIAQGIIEALKVLPEAEQVIYAGSLRRMKETVGDIDILVSSTKPEAVMDAFTTLPQITEVLSKGKTKSSVIAEKGTQIDVRVVEPQSFGAAIQYFTGSKEHNIKLRELAIHKELKINEYGVFRVKTGEKIAGRTEEEVYSVLDLPWVPPELREDRGEIEAAKANRLPILIEISDIKGDLHVHTNWSDGTHTITEMVERAERKGYQYLAITDHSYSLRIAGGLSEERLKEQIREIGKLNEKIDKFEILSGIEVDIKRDGSLDYSDDLLKQLDIVIAAIHSGFKMDMEAMTLRIIKAMRNKYVNIIAHPTGRIIGERDPYQVDIEQQIMAAAETGTFLEINAFPDRLDLKDIHAQTAKEKGVLLCLGTDAHNIMHLDLMFYGVATARRGWLERKDLLNTLPVEKLMEKLRQKRS